MCIDSHPSTSRDGIGSNGPLLSHIGAIGDPSRKAPVRTRLLGFFQLCRSSDLPAVLRTDLCRLSFCITIVGSYRIDLCWARNSIGGRLGQVHTIHLFNIKSTVGIGHCIIIGMPTDGIITVFHCIYTTELLSNLKTRRSPWIERRIWVSIGARLSGCVLPSLFYASCAGDLSCGHCVCGADMRGRPTIFVQIGQTFL